MRRLARLLAARWLTPYLLIGYVVFLSFLAGWGATIPTEVVGNISRLLPFWLAYAAGGAHLLLCLWLFVPVVLQRTSLAVPADEVGKGAALSDSGIADIAREGRLRIRWIEPDRTAVLHRNRWSPAGTLLFHGALLLLPLAFALSRATRFSGEAWIVEGHPFGGTRAEYAKVEPSPEAEGRLPEVRIHVEGIEARFWGDRLFFTDLRALAVEGSGASMRPAWMTLPDPLWIRGTRVSLRGFNYTLAYEIAGAGGRLLDSGDLKLRLFPPGTEDSFTVPGLPHRFFVRLYPDADSRSMALGRPLLHVAVTRGKELVRRGFVRPGEPLSFDGLELRLPQIRRGGEILVHRDWGYPVLWAALLLALGGLVARIAFPSVRIWIVREDGGSRRVIVREDDFAEGTAARLLEGSEAGPARRSRGADAR